jgi:catechol 2,3-dioxygenase-like lactoylglutathione lyase family enzyme
VLPRFRRVCQHPSLSTLRSVQVFETVLYARDIPAIVDFYCGTLGLRMVEEPDELAAIFRLDGGMLLVFDPDRSSVPGRPAPSHGADGPGHVAFRVEPAELDRCAQRLRQAGVETEKEVDRGGGQGRALYVRDPAGNSVELLDGDPWPP